MNCKTNQDEENQKTFKGSSFSRLNNYKLALLSLFIVTSWFSFGEVVSPDSNLLTCGVVVTGSSFYGLPPSTGGMKVKTNNYYDKLYDNNPATFWRPMDKNAPHWLEFRWRYPLKTNKLSWHSAGLKNGTLQYWENGQWNSIRNIHGGSGTIEFSEILTDRLRLEISQAEENLKNFELGVNGPSQTIATATFPDKTTNNEKSNVLIVI